MKQIRVTRNLGDGLPRYREGQVVDVSDEECDRLVSRGLAEVLRAVPPVADVVGIPPESIAPLEEGSVEHATEKLKMYRARQRRTKTEPINKEP